MTDSFEVQGDFSSDHLSPTEDLSAPLGTIDEAVAELPNGFVRLGLAPELLQAVHDMGYAQPTIVQDRVIPQALGDQDADGASRLIDLMVSSQTGSGKTAAFLLPVLHTLLMQEQQAAAAQKEQARLAAEEALARGEAPPKRAKRKDPTNPRHFKAATPGALVLCPTRELAQQVAHDAIDLVRHCRGLRIASVIGGLPYAQQIAKLQNASLVVATPGRLLDLQNSGQIKLDQVQFLVIDEADRMLDLGFADALAEINQLTAQRRQTMMFSATFAPRIMALGARAMREPQRVEIDSPQDRHQNITQILHWADNPVHKRKLLDHWLRDTKIEQAIVFASTQVECDELANELAGDGFSAVALHGALSQGMRNRRLMMIREGRAQILVATDVAARGLDVPSISHVFNYGLPMKAEDYTHRIGRTGRAGRDGKAITIAEFRDRRRVFDVESYTHQTFKPEVIAGLEPQQRPPQVGRGIAERAERRGGRQFGPGAASFGAPRRYENDNRSFGGAGFNAGGPGRDAGFAEGKRAAPRSYADKTGFNARQSDARQPGPDAYKGRSEPRGYAPRGAEFAPRGDRAPGFAPRSGPRADFAPRAGFAPRGEAAPRGEFAPRAGDFVARAPTRAPAGKVFVPRDAKKRPARPAR